MLYLVLSPVTWSLLLAALLALAWRHLGKPWRVGGLLLLAVLTVLLTPLGANALVRRIEAQLPAPLHCQGQDRAALVVLSGGFARTPADVGDYSALNQESWGRLRHAVDLWRRGDGGVLVIAGGGPYAVKESAMLARLARDWGVPAAAIRTETRSTTTWQSAFELRGRLPARIRLVSSALHLPRALLAFRAAGFQPCPESSGSAYLPSGGLGYFMPQTSAIEKSEAAIHEWIGGIQYGLRAGGAPGRKSRDAAQARER